MEKKKLLIPILITIIAVVFSVVFLLTREADPIPPETVGTMPAVQNQTTPTQPPQTTAPDLTEPAASETTEPEETIPAQTDPVETEPKQTEPKQTEPRETEPEETEPVYDSVEFPVELEDGLLTVHSLFQFSGMNPDADNLFGENIAGVQLTNDSDRHMARAEVTAVLYDGTTLTFLAEDVPAGKTVMAFCLEHESVADVRSCEELFGYAEFESDDPLRRDLVRITVSGTEITLRNVSGKDLTDLDVICHGVLDSSLYGGTTYHYNVASLPAGASTVIHAVDCFLGMAEVVRVELGG